MMMCSSCISGDCHGYTVSAYKNDAHAFAGFVKVESFLDGFEGEHGHRFGLGEVEFSFYRAWACKYCDSAFSIVCMLCSHALLNLFIGEDVFHDRREVFLFVWRDLFELVFHDFYYASRNNGVYGL